MLHLSTGIDCELVDRFRRLLAQDMHLDLFAPIEHAYGASATDPAQTYAGMWCAKEATVKAVSSAVSLDARAVVIEHDDRNRPVARFVPEAGMRLPSVVLSITHTHEMALAVAISWTDGEPQ